MLIRNLSESRYARGRLTPLKLVSDTQLTAVLHESVEVAFWAVHRYLEYRKQDVRKTSRPEPKVVQRALQRSQYSPYHSTRCARR